MKFNKMNYSDFSLWIDSATEGKQYEIVQQTFSYTIYRIFDTKGIRLFLYEENLEGEAETFFEIPTVKLTNSYNSEFIDTIKQKEFYHKGNSLSVKIEEFEVTGVSLENVPLIATEYDITIEHNSGISSISQSLTIATFYTEKEAINAYNAFLQID